MARHVVVGAGPVGRETARLLAEKGDTVRLVSRRGVGVPRVEAVALDARDADALTRVSEGAEALFMCAMAPYDKWPAEFPPIMEGVAKAAETVGARILVVGNTYGYGEDARSPLTPDLPLKPTTVKGVVRAAMWERALSSAVPALEVRASDYLGEDAFSVATLMVFPSIVAGGQAVIPGNPDILHSWSFTKDVARTLVAETGTALSMPPRSMQPRANWQSVSLRSRARPILTCEHSLRTSCTRWRKGIPSCGKSKRWPTCSQSLRSWMPRRRQNSWASLPVRSTTC